MKRYIFYHLSEIIILLVIILTISLSVYLVSKVEHKKVRGVVVSHNVTSDKYGNRTYSTLVKTEDGYIQEVTDLNVYAIPVGKAVIIEVSRPLEIKFNK